MGAGRAEEDELRLDGACARTDAEGPIVLHNTIDEEYPDARRRGRADDHDADAEELAAHAYCCGVLHAAAAPG